MARDGRSREAVAPFLLLVLTPTLFSCTDPTRRSPTVLRADSAGIELVSMVGELPTRKPALEERFVLGGAPEGPESFFRVDPSLVGVGPGGEIHVLDPLNHRIVVFSPEGDVLRTLGREGDGPGEFRQPFAMAVAEGGTIVVADRARRTLTRLTPRGEPLEPVAVEAPIFGAADVDIVGATPVFLWWRWTGRASGFHMLMWGGTDPRMVAQVEVSGDAEGRSFPSCPQAFPGAPYLDPGLVWSASRAGVAVVPNHDYEIRVFSPQGELRRIIRRDVDREPVTVEALREHMEDPFMANAGRGPQALCPVPLEEAIRIKGYLDRVPAISTLFLSDDGQVWARRGAIPLSAGAIDVFDADGTPLGTLPAETPFPVAFTRDGLASIRADSMGVERLVLWGGEGEGGLADER